MIYSELDNLLKLRKRILVNEERILELISKTVSTKCQIISDMPKGGRASNDLDEYIIKKEKLEIRATALNHRINAKWDCVMQIFSAANLKEYEIELMKYRFFYGLQWKKCSEQMKLIYPDSNWNNQKAYRVYRCVLLKIHKTMS